MSLIKDIKEEVKILLFDKKSLRKFGLMIGGIFLTISLILFISETAGIIFWLLIIFGGFLFLLGLFAPKLLRHVYFGWMTGAIVLGWFVSRIILTILFFLVIAPIGFIAKIVAKEFLDLNFSKKRKSYWISREKGHKVNYSKMY